MNAKVLGGAAVGAVVGAGIWAAIAATTGYEVGWIAWIIGILVGGLARAAGGDGHNTGLVCAVLALASIFVGKMVTVHLLLGSATDDLAAEVLTPDFYDELMYDAEEFAKLQSEDQYPQFMVDHDYIDTDDPLNVTADDLDEFVRVSVPELKRMYDEQPDFATWRREEVAEMERFTKDISLTDAVIEDLGVIDIVFAVLGLVTAYKVGVGDG